MADTKLFMVQGDTSPSLNLTIERDGTPIDITGATIRFLIFNTATEEQTNEGHDTCAIIEAPTGKVNYSFEENDLPDAATYLCDVSTTFPNGNCETAPGYVIIHAREKARIS